MKKFASLLLCLLLFAAPLTVRAVREEPTPVEPISATEPITEPTQPEGIDPLSEEPIEGKNDTP